MEAKELQIPGAWLFTPRQFPDPRGLFLEWFKEQVFTGAVGHPFTVRQANHSVSQRGTLRGVHFAEVPPGQAKYVYCPRGAILDVVVDLRIGSPTFGSHSTVQLDDVDRRAVYLSEGLGHAFLALTDDANVNYLVSEPYNPAREHGVHPLDPDLAIDWPAGIQPQLSERDAAAPSLAAAQEQGLLPDWSTCQSYVAGLRQ